MKQKDIDRRTKTLQIHAAITAELEARMDDDIMEVNPYINKISGLIPDHNKRTREQMLLLIAACRYHANLLQDEIADNQYVEEETEEGALSIKDIMAKISEMGKGENAGKFMELLSEYTPEQDCFDTPGDLQELNVIIILGEFDKFSNMKDFMMAASQFMEAEDIEDLPRIKVFREQFQKLYRTMEVWAWS